MNRPATRAGPPPDAPGRPIIRLTLRRGRITMRLTNERPRDQQLPYPPSREGVPRFSGRGQELRETSHADRRPVPVVCGEAPTPGRLERPASALSEVQADFQAGGG